MAGHMSAESSEPPPWTGPWADDARRLFQVFQTTLDQLAEPLDDDQPHPPECRYCPLCRGVALLREAGPDLLDQVSELAAGLAATLRTSAPPTAPSDSSDSADDTTAGAPARPPSTVRIDVTD
jgi:hypothetical protein